MNYKIKDEFIGKTIKVYNKHTGTKAVSIASLDMSKVEYYITTGLKHIFEEVVTTTAPEVVVICLLYTSPSPRDRQKSRMPSSA